MLSDENGVLDDVELDEHVLELCLIRVLNHAAANSLVLQLRQGVEHLDAFPLPLDDHGLMQVLSFVALDMNLLVDFLH